MKKQINQKQDNNSPVKMVELKKEKKVFRVCHGNVMALMAHADATTGSSSNLLHFCFISSALLHKHIQYYPSEKYTAQH